jgi:hypothetical protein
MYWKDATDMLFRARNEHSRKLLVHGLQATETQDHWAFQVNEADRKNISLQISYSHPLALLRLNKVKRRSIVGGQVPLVLNTAVPTAKTL